MRPARSGVGRKGEVDHKGSFGFCRWSRSEKRWEWIEGCFKTVAFGVAGAGIAAGAVGVVDLWWMRLTGAVAGEDSGSTVDVLNGLGKDIVANSRVSMAFDRMENLWFVTGVEHPDGLTVGPQVIAGGDTLTFVGGHLTAWV